jgi:cbb3-type cytochrome oxidase maturation protein
MDSLYLLLPLSVLLVLALIGVFAWALHEGQFDDLEREGWRVLEGTEPVVPPPLPANAEADSRLQDLTIDPSDRDSPLE